MKYRYISHRIQLIRSFYSGIGKTVVIYPSAFLVSSGIGIVALGIIFYLKYVFNVLPSEIGILSALWSALYVLGCLFLRPVFNKVLPRYMLIASTLMMGVLVLLILSLKKIQYIYYLYSFWGLIISLFWPSLNGWLSQGYEGQKLSKIMSGYNFSWSLGTIVSPFLAGFLSSIDKSLPIIVGSILFFSTTLILTGASLSLPKIKSDRWIEVISKSDARRIDKSTPLRYPAWVGVFSTYVIIGIILNVFPMYAIQTLELNEKSVGLIMQQRAIFATIGFLLLGKITFWHFNWIQMIASQIFLSIMAYLLATTYSNLAIGILFALIGFITSLGYFNGVFHGVSGSPRRSTRMAINESLIATGQIVGSLLGSIIYESISMRMVYFFSSMLALTMSFIQIVMIYYFYKKGKLNLGR